jgi:sterol desaturase/sphingolipid hydroxylase (fatty acid hydroxylase superfamily)
MTSSLIRYAYAPLLLIGFNAAALALIAGGASHAWLPLLLVLAIVVSFLVERRIPYERGWNDDHGDSRRDLAHLVVNETFALASVAALPALASIATVTDAWPDSWPFALQAVMAILVFDLGITVAHFLSHHWGPLWRLHAVHHSVKRFYGLNGLMKHPLHQAVELSVGIAPLLVIGIPTPVAWALAFAVAIQLLLQHSNADYSVGPLKGVLALNEAHRFHHLKWAGVGDVNFGLFTLLYDRLLLRTFSYDPSKRFTSDDIGIAKEPDYPDAYAEQMLHPFRKPEEVRPTGPLPRWEERGRRLVLPEG